MGAGHDRAGADAHGGDLDRRLPEATEGVAGPPRRHVASCQDVLETLLGCLTENVLQAFRIQGSLQAMRAGGPGWGPHLLPALLLGLDELEQPVLASPDLAAELGRVDAEVDLGDLGL